MRNSIIYCVLGLALLAAPTIGVPLAVFPGVARQLALVPAPFDYDGIPLEAAIADLRIRHNMPITLDPACADASSSFSMCGPDVPLCDIASFICSVLDLHAFIDGEGVLITDDPSRAGEVGYYTLEELEEPSFWRKVRGYWF